jgi:glucose/arabinose dehydrogenase
MHELHDAFAMSVQGNDGYIYLITDSGNGLLLRIRPKR